MIDTQETVIYIIDDKFRHLDNHLDNIIQMTHNTAYHSEWNSKNVS